jgi:hypothetical protein
MLALALLASVTAALAHHLLKTPGMTHSRPAGPERATATQGSRRAGLKPVASLLRAARSLRSQDLGDEAMELSRQHLTQWQASLNRRLPERKDAEGWTELKEDEKAGRDDPRRTARAPEAKAEQRHDPWSKMLSELTDHDNQRRRRSK